MSNSELPSRQEVEDLLYREAALLDENGIAVDEATASYALHTPSPGWTEQDPQDWWVATCQVLNALWSRGNAAASVAAGICG